jgi:acyl-CoA synthetase (AMP-forming)/AMP-acid ligase II
MSDAPWSWLDLPPRHLREYAGTGAWLDRTLADLAIDLTSENPDVIVLNEGDSSVSRSGLMLDAQALAASLSELGLSAGDVVSFQTPTWHEAAVINMAAALSGIVINPIVPIYRDAEVRMMLYDSRSKALFVPRQFRNFDFTAMAERLRPDLPELRHVFTVRGEGALTYCDLVASGRGRAFDRPRVDPGAVKMLLYTSGTTGRPKGVLHSHNTMIRVMRQLAEHWRVADGDALLVPSPVTHTSGYSTGLEMPFVIGTRSILMDVWNAAEAVTLIERHRIAGTVAATPFLTELAAAAGAAGTRIPSLRFFACGGAAVPPDLIPAARRAFDNCAAFRVFGSSEVPLVTLGYPEARDAVLAATTDGLPVDYDVRIVDDHGAAVVAGAEGEILARGPAMFLGYADRKDTEEAITGDGYFRTGDLGRATPEGAIIITGRKKDLIIRGGENISAKEIEDVLFTHPAVQEASVVAMPHPRLGEGICAYIVPLAGRPVEGGDLARYVERSGLAKQKIPERFEFVGDLPRNPSGKIRKDTLREDIRQKIASEAERAGTQAANH